MKPFSQQAGKERGELSRILADRSESGIQILLITPETFTSTDLQEWYKPYEARDGSHVRKLVAIALDEVHSVLGCSCVSEKNMPRSSLILV